MPERTAQARRREIIYRNLLNGCSIAQAADAERVSSADVFDTFGLVTGKIKSYMMERHMPWMDIDTIPAAKRNRIFCLHILDRINLDKLPHFRNIVSMPLDEKFLRDRGIVLP